MKFLRGLLAVPFFLALPVALFVFINASVLQDNYAQAMERSVDQLLDANETQEFVEEAAIQMLDANPQLESRLSELGEPKGVLTRALLVTSRTPEFKTEVRRITGELAEIIRTGEVTDLTLDLRPAIEASSDRLRPEVSTTLETQMVVVNLDLTDFEDDIRPVHEGIANVRGRAGVIAGVSAFFLLALTMTLRSIAASMFFVGLPALGLQLLILNALREGADGIFEETVVGELVAAWNPITWMMFISTLIAGVLFFSWKRLFRSTPKDESTGPISPTAPSIPVADGDYIYRGKPAEATT